MKKQFLTYAVPSALAMCISSFNTVLDGVFLGQGIGDIALAAVNVVIPLTIMFFGMATMIAVGGGSLVSKNLGAGNEEKAVQVFRQVMKLLLIGSIVLSTICVVFAEPIVKLLGATANLTSLSAEYLRFYAMFCIPNLLGIAFGSFLRNDGRPQLAMVATVIGTICNIILNYVFIFKLGLGVKSAAIATGIGQTITVSIMLPHFMRRRGKLTFGKAKMERSMIKEVLSIGVPSFIAEAAFSVIILIHNIIITKVLGETGLSVYSIINYITTNIYMILLGVTFGAQPLISYNYGRKMKEKMLEVYKLSIITTQIITLSFYAICLFFGRNIIGIFTSDETILNMTYIALNINNIAYFMIGRSLTRTVYYQAIEMPKYSNLIGILRSVIVLPVVIIVMTRCFGAMGIWMSMVVSELITIFITNCIVDMRACTTKSLLVQTSHG